MSDGSEEHRRGSAGWGGSALPALALVAAVFVLRVIYAVWWCPYELVEDEAHYWLWARYPDWSYYSKGPGVAWAIWLATKMWGNAEWAVRMPAAVLSSLGAACVAGLAWDAARARVTGTGGQAARGTRSTIAFYATAAYLLAPAMQATGVLMTIDGPYLACWAAACWAAWRAMERSSRAAWLALGAAVAAGFLFKYTMLLLIPGLAWYAWARRGRLDLCANTKMWVLAGAAVALLGLLPVVIWNAQNGWVTVSHLLGHLGLPGGDMPRGAGGGERSPWSPFWVFELIGMQLGMVGPGVVLACVAAWRVWKQPEREAGKVFLVCAGVPVLAFYLVVALIAEPEGNWPLAGWVTLLPLGGWWAAELMRKRREWMGNRSGTSGGQAASPSATRKEHLQRKPRRWVWHATVVYGVVGAVLLHRVDWTVAGVNALNHQRWFRAAFERVTGREPRRVEAVRLFGSRVMVAQIEGLLDRLRKETGREPFIITQHYGRASQMAYELARRGKRVDVLSAMEQTGGRRSQFDVWAHTSLRRPDLIGRPAVILSNNRTEVRRFWESVFESVEMVEENGGRLDGEHKQDRFGFLGRGYRGYKDAGVTDGERAR